MNYDILQGDCIETMRSLPSGIVQTCVTSPPYYGLRDYGTASWEGGDPECDHVERRGGHLAQSAASTRGGGHKQAEAQSMTYRDTCGKCGARRVDNQIGLEETPEAYVAKLVEVFREVRRLLHPTGTLWCNLGDSYNGSGGAGGDYGVGGLKEGQPKYPGRNVNGLGPKQLLGIPWRVAFALQADGWILRSDIIWHKKAPMPESVTDRVTKAHEYVFLLSKQASYFYDAEAIAEPAEAKWEESHYKYYRGKGTAVAITNPDRPDLGTGGERFVGGEGRFGATRNKRSVWTLGPESYSGAHFATMPTKLVEPCILAGSSSYGCCAKCGSPWARVVERQLMNTDGWGKATKDHTGNISGSNASIRNGNGRLGDSVATTLGWAATCTCNADVVPCVVLDPFAGAGTTLLVANRYGRRAIGCELNPEYIKLATERLDRNQPMLAGLTL